MYGQSKTNWFQAIFWLMVGLFLGQFFRFNIDLKLRDTSVTQQVQTIKEGEQS